MFQIIQDIFYYELLMIGKDFIINVIKREFLRYDILVLSRIRIKMYKEISKLPAKQTTKTIVLTDIKTAQISRQVG